MTAHDTAPADNPLHGRSRANPTRSTDDPAPISRSKRRASQFLSPLLCILLTIGAGDYGYAFADPSIFVIGALTTQMLSYLAAGIFGVLALATSVLACFGWTSSTVILTASPSTVERTLREQVRLLTEQIETQAAEAAALREKIHRFLDAEAAVAAERARAEAAEHEARTLRAALAAAHPTAQ